MTISGYWLQRQIASSLVMFLAIPLAARAQQAPPGQQESASYQQAHPEEPANTPAANSTQNIPVAPSSPSTQSSNPGGTAPVGTAAAPYEKPLGVAASRPAGAVIAPAKQRRTRSIAIRVGLLVGAAAAIGTVVALSKSSPSRPN